MNFNSKSFIFFLFVLHSTMLSAVTHKPQRDKNNIEILEIKPGGETLCARGEEFSFFVKPGNSNKVIIDFIGGGACWSEETCAKEQAVFSDSVDDIREKIAERDLNGIYDYTKPNHPFADWNHVIVPYCTGDIHWGENDVTYGKGDKEFVIHHRGAINTQSVLKWIEENYTQPEKVLVTGCSAGAYGSIYWTPQIREMYPNAKTYQLADSGAGVITDNFFSQSFNLWNTQKNAAVWIPGLNPAESDWNKLNINGLYRSIGQFYPDVKFSQFNYINDNIQVFFYEIMGGAGPSEWRKNMLANISTIKNDLPNFQYFTAPGEAHCIIPYNRMYEQKSDGISFLNWFKDFVDDKNTENIECQECLR